MDAKRLALELRVAWGALPRLAGDREALAGWLKGARRAQVALALAVVLGIFVMPPARDALVDAVAPERTVGRVWRRRREEHPLAGSLRFVVGGIYWLGSLGAAGALLLLDLPPLLRRRERRPGREEGAGAAVDADAATLLPTAAAAHAGRAEPSAEQDGVPMPGGRYAIEGELGRGGMGVVHRARDTVLDRVVALKELPRALRSTPGLAERFRTEARVLARLTHPGIVQIFDLVEDEHGMWMAMELVPGGSLDARIAAGALPLAEVLSLGRRMAEAMAYAHAQGVVHRDFKPHNVLLTPEGEPKVGDFGLAKLAQGPSLTQEGTVLGSPAYMSPEQASGREADARSDVYALGATLFEMLTGRPPFTGDTTSVLMQHITQPPPSPSEIGARGALPAPLEQLVLAMLAKEAGARPEGMHAVAHALDAIASSGDAS
jgi:hypothetical protein